MNMKKGFIIGAGGLFLCLAAILYKLEATPEVLGENRGDDTISQVDKITDATDEKNRIPVKQNENKGEIEYAVYLKGELKLPEKEKEQSGSENVLNVYDNEMLILEETFSDLLLNRLRKKGWGEYSFQVMEKGSYYLKSKSQGSILTDKKKYLVLAKEFIRDSGLKFYLNKKDIGLDYKVEGEKGQYSAFCYLLYDKKKTGSCIRMNFEGDKICAECLMYLYQVKLLEKLPAKSWRIAMKNAFYIDSNAKEKNDYQNYVVKNLGMKYVNGLPYYTFNAYGTDTRIYLSGYALAVDIEKAENKNKLEEKYLSFSIK